MRSVKFFAADSIEYCEEIASYLGDIDSELNFVNDNLVRQAVRAQLINIGEAVSKLPPLVREKYPETDWRRISAFRNVLVHEYFGLDWSIIWISASQDVPELLTVALRLYDSLDEGATDLSCKIE